MWGFLFETLTVDYKKEVRIVIMYMYEPAHLSRHRSEMYSPVKAKNTKKTAVQTFKLVVIQ